MTVTEISVLVAADVLVVPIVIIAAIAMLRVPTAQRYQLIVKGICTGLIALLFAKIAGLLYPGGVRPFEQMGVEPMASYMSNHGFPSDHTLFVFTITAVVWVSTKSKILTLILLVMSALVAGGRIAALVHAPIDIVGGITFALLAAFIIYGRKLFTKQKVG